MNPAGVEIAGWILVGVAVVLVIYGQLLAGIIVGVLAVILVLR